MREKQEKANDRNAEDNKAPHSGRRRSQNRPGGDEVQQVSGDHPLGGPHAGSICGERAQGAERLEAFGQRPAAADARAASGTPATTAAIGWPCTVVT